MEGENVYREWRKRSIVVNLCNKCTKHWVVAAIRIFCMHTAYKHNFNSFFIMHVKCKCQIVNVGKILHSSFLSLYHSMLLTTSKAIIPGIKTVPKRPNKKQHAGACEKEQSPKQKTYSTCDTRSRITSNTTIYNTAGAIHSEQCPQSFT